MHGESHGSWCWDACADELPNEAHQTATFDLSGHRQDPTSSDPVNMKDDAEAVRDQREPCGTETPLLPVHSLAGIDKSANEPSPNISKALSK